MKYTVNPYNSFDPWEELELQRKFDNSTYEDEELEIESDVDDVEEDDYSDDDE